MSEAKPLALVVDDEVQIRRFLRAGLELDGFAVEEAESGIQALRCATLQPPDLVILDLGLPDMDGSEVLERLRGWSTVPVIVLSVRSHEGEKVRLLEKGGDDYVVKPFGMAELLARAHAAMRRYARASTGEPVISIGPLSIDLAARIVTVDGARVMLTPKEYRLLQLLAQHAGNVVTHQFLLKEIWGAPHLNDTHYLRIFMRKLRQKIEADPTQPRILLTELGVGYRLVTPEAAAGQRVGATAGAFGPEVHNSVLLHSRPAESGRARSKPAARSRATVSPPKACWLATELTGYTISLAGGTGLKPPYSVKGSRRQSPAHHARGHARPARAIARGLP